MGAVDFRLEAAGLPCFFQFNENRKIVLKLPRHAQQKVCDLFVTDVLEPALRQGATGVSGVLQSLAGRLGRWSLSGATGSGTSHARPGSLRSTG